MHLITVTISSYLEIVSSKTLHRNDARVMPNPRVDIFCFIIICL